MRRENIFFFGGLRGRGMGGISRPHGTSGIARRCNEGVRPPIQGIFRSNKVAVAPENIPNSSAVGASVPCARISDVARAWGAASERWGAWSYVT